MSGCQRALVCDDGVTPSGQTTEIEVVESDPGTLFDKSAQNAVSQWRFEPLEYRGRTISQRATTRLVYRADF